MAKDSEDFRHQLQARRKKGSSKEKEKREESHKVTLNLDDIDKIVLTFTGNIVFVLINRTCSPHGNCFERRAHRKFVRREPRAPSLRWDCWRQIRG